jgi:hypothetical protein
MVEFMSPVGSQPFQACVRLSNEKSGQVFTLAKSSMGWLAIGN